MTLFTRYAAEHTGPIITTSNGKPAYVRRDPCHRCGGQGGADVWKHTGWKCYRCNGERFEAARQAPLYTRDQLDRLNAIAARKAAKKAAKKAPRKR